MLLARVRRPRVGGCAAGVRDLLNPVEPQGTYVDSGFMHLEGPFETVCDAMRAAEGVAHRAERSSPLGAGMPALAPVGEFVIPPEGAPVRDFQLLHLDFGLPVASDSPTDVARYTALHVPIDRPPSGARTRIVRLDVLLGQRAWPPAGALLNRLVEYGSGGADYVEGILARLIEAVDDGDPSLPSHSECLCGTELDGIAEEREHFARRGLNLDDAEALVDVRPGQLLVLDNLATAHGRIGRRRPSELHQLMLGYRLLAVDRQVELRDRVLSAFTS